MNIQYDTSAINAGTYTAQVTLSNSNYLLTGTTSQEFEIGKYNAVVTPDAGQSASLGTTDFDLSYTSNLTEDMTPLSGKLTASGEYIGDTPILQGTITDENNPNYSVRLSDDVVYISITPNIYGVIQSQSSDIQTAEAIPESIKTITEWDSFYVQLWSAESVIAGQIITTTVVYNSQVYTPQLSAILTPDWVESISYDSKVLENSDNTEITITMTVESNAEIAENTHALMAQIPFTPAEDSTSGLDVGTTITDFIEVDSQTTSTEATAFSFDLNNDTKVNMADFILFATNFNTLTDDQSLADNTNLTDEMKVLAKACDFNDDGVVNMDDFIQFAMNFNKTKPVITTASAAAPVSAAACVSTEVANVSVETAESIQIQPIKAVVVVQPIQSTAITANGAVNQQSSTPVSLNQQSSTVELLETPQIELVSIAKAETVVSTDIQSDATSDSTAIIDAIFADSDSTLFDPVEIPESEYQSVPIELILDDDVLAIDLLDN